MTGFSGAPNFTTRVGASVVSHQPPDPLALRSAAQIRADPRSNFKDRYGMHKPPGSPSFPDRKHPIAGSLAGDTSAQMQIEQLQTELAQARAEIVQLRTALHYAGLSLQGVGSWEKLPGELRCHLEAHHRMVDELTGTLQERDAEILRLSRQSMQRGKIVDRYRHTLLNTVGAWSESGALLLAWSSWKEIMREKHRETDMTKAIAKAKAGLKPTVARSFLNFAAETDSSLLRFVIVNWLAAARTQKMESDRAAHKKERVEATLLKWSSGYQNTALHVCWVKWRDRLREQAEAKQAEERRLHELESAKQLKRESIMHTTMAMVETSEGKMSPMMSRLVLTAWRNYAIDIKAQKTLDEQRQAAKEQKERQKAQTKRHFLMMMDESDKAHVAWIFATWREYIQSIKQEKHMELLKTLQGLFHAWFTQTKNHQRDRELKKARKEFEEYEAQHEDQLHKQRSRRNAFAELGFRASVSSFLQMIWSAWLECVAESKRSKEMEAEKAAWEKEWLKQQAEHKNKDKARSVGIAFSICNKSEAVANHILLTVAWSALVQARDDALREKKLDAKQRVFEDDLQHALDEKQKALDEAAKLERETQEMDERMQAMDSHHHDKQQIRSVIFLTTLADRDKALVLHSMWSAWRDCVRYAREEVKMMQEKLKHEVRFTHLPQLAEVMQPPSEPSEDWSYPHHHHHTSCWPRCLTCRCCRHKKAGTDQHIANHHHHTSCWPRCLSCRCCRHKKARHIEKHDEKETKHDEKETKKVARKETYSSRAWEFAKHAFHNPLHSRSKRRKGKAAQQVSPEVDLPTTHQAAGSQLLESKRTRSKEVMDELLLDVKVELKAMEEKVEGIAARLQQRKFSTSEVRAELAKVEEDLQKLKVDKVDSLQELATAEKHQQLARIERLSQHLEYLFSWLKAIEDPPPPPPASRPAPLDLEDDEPPDAMPSPSEDDV